MVTARIGITGTHRTGKTLLARRIEMELRGAGLAVARVSGTARRAAEIGFPKMTRHTASSAQWIMLASSADAVAAELEADAVICEHTPIDTLAYWLAALDHRGENPDPDDLLHLTSLATVLSEPNTILFATAVDPAIPLGEHPGRDPDYVDAAYRAGVDGHLHRLLAEFAIEHHLMAGPEGLADAVGEAVAAATKALGS